MIAACKHVLDQFACLCGASLRDQGVDVPKRANDERIFRAAEIILVDVAKQERSPFQLTFDGIDRADEAGVVRTYEPHLMHQQQAGIDRLTSETTNKAVELGVP